MESLQLTATTLLGWARPLQAFALTLSLGAAAGLLALADLPTLAIHTALHGDAAVLDILTICPGLHRQHAAASLHQAEYPAAAALTTGYVFRIENPATVFFLQRTSQTGALTNLTVSRSHANHKPFPPPPLSSLLSLLPPSLTILSLALLIHLHDPLALTFLLLLILTRTLSTLSVTRRRRATAAQWHGQSEPGVAGDLLVLLSQDRWVRVRGPVDDLKAVTSGRWLCEPRLAESAMQATATMLAYGAAGLAAGMTSAGALVVGALLVVSAGVVGWGNARVQELSMHGCVVGLDEERGVRRYGRRLEMVAEMLSEVQVGRDEEMMRLGLARMGVTVPDRPGEDGETRGGDRGGVVM